MNLVLTLAGSRTSLEKVKSLLPTQSNVVILIANCNGLLQPFDRERKQQICFLCGVGNVRNFGHLSLLQPTIS